MALALLPIVFVLTVMSSTLLLRQRGQRLKPPWLTFVLVAVTFVVGTFAVFDQAVSDVLRRDFEKLVAGEWWRLISPLVGQDGGLVGLIFNVVVLLFAGAAVENLFGPWMLAGVYLAAGVLSEVAAYTVMPGQGYAGNSVGCMGLAGLLLVSAVVADPPARLIGILGLAAGILLLVFWDLHGIGFAVGALAGLGYWLKTRPRRSATRVAPGSPAESSAGS
ncbi:MAG: rhomboid family intramembrane serine protease [Pseudolysinimonas sp.]